MKFFEQRRVFREDQKNQEPLVRTEFSPKNSPSGGAEIFDFQKEFSGLQLENFRNQIHTIFEISDKTENASLILENVKKIRILETDIAKNKDEIRILLYQILENTRDHNPGLSKKAGEIFDHLKEVEL